MALLRVEGITKRFGGLVANHRISFAVRPGEIVGLIGPNGAGKSTLFDVITGHYRPEAGDITFENHPLVGRRPDQVSRLGIGRTFQKLRPFHAMTVLENVTVAAMQHEVNPTPCGTWSSWSWRRSGTASPGISAPASASAWSWPGPWPRAPACFSWTR
jgi:branched-chain amino acid transport system ATP-binding protein